MENILKGYLDELEQEYGRKNVKITYTECKVDKDNKVPKVLKYLYNIIDRAEFPFGEIFSIEEALEESKGRPFYPNWFVFGSDYYSTYWLCSYTPDNKGLSFLTWDNASPEIGEATRGDITSFLKKLEKRYLRRKSFEM